MNYGYYFRLTNTNKCSIIVLVRNEKAYPFKWCWRTYSDRLFHIHTYKFIVQNGLEFETQQIAVT